MQAQYQLVDRKKEEHSSISYFLGTLKAAHHQSCRSAYYKQEIHQQKRVGSPISISLLTLTYDLLVPLTLCELKYGLQYTSSAPPQIVVQPKTQGKETYDLLLVEDNTDMRNFIVRSLPDFRITTAANGKEAIEKALKNRPGILLVNQREFVIRLSLLIT